MAKKMTLADEVKRRREQLGWSVLRLADEADLHPQTVEAVESGASQSPHRSTLRLLAQALRCTVEELDGSRAAL